MSLPLLLQVAVTWSATCGTITRSGLWTPPAEPSPGGACTVTATADSATTAVPVRFRRPSPVGGMPLAAFNAGTTTGGFTALLNAETPERLKRDLAAARQGGYCIIAATAGGSHSSYLGADGLWSYQLWRQYGYERYRPDSAIWAAAIREGTLCGVSNIDEPQNGPVWGGQPIPWTMVDSVACTSKRLFIGVPHYVRANATHLDDYPGWRCLDGGILQYSNDRHFGEAAGWVAKQLAVATRRNFALLVGVNAENGGGVADGCIPSVSRRGRCSMSAAELERILPVLAADSTVVCGITLWGPDTTWWAAYAGRQDIAAALGRVAAWARRRTPPACLRR